MWRSVGHVLALSMLSACRAKNPETLKPQDAAHWLYQACGISLAQDPVVITSTPAAAAAHQGSSVAITATVALPDSEVASALEALRNNRSLHMRGQSESRHSYESYPEARPGKECELDSSLHVLYFRYTE